MDKEAQAFRAQQILEDPIISGFFESLEDQLVLGIKSAPARDSDGIYRIALMMQIAEKFKAHLQSYINEGKILAFEAEVEQKKRKKTLL